MAVTDVVDGSEGRCRWQWRLLQMAVRVVVDGSESRCRWQWGSLKMAVRVVADGSEGRSRWKWGSLQMALRVVTDGSDGRCRWQWGSLQMALRVITDGSEGRWVHMIEHGASGVRSSIYVYRVSISPVNLLRDLGGGGVPWQQFVLSVNLLHVDREDKPWQPPTCTTHARRYTDVIPRQPLIVNICISIGWLKYHY